MPPKRATRRPRRENAPKTPLPEARPDEDRERIVAAAYAKLNTRGGDDQAERLDLVQRARKLERGARREVDKAPPLPANPDADSPEAVEWTVSHVYAPDVLKSAESALAKIAAGQWDSARSDVVEAELNEKKANDLFEMLLRHRLIKQRDDLQEKVANLRGDLREENKQLVRVKRQLGQIERRQRKNARGAAKVKTEQAGEREANYLRAAAILREKYPRMSASEMARRLVKDDDVLEGDQKPVKVDTIRKYLASNRRRAFGITPANGGA